jgi:hypothetical protein
VFRRALLTTTAAAVLAAAPAGVASAGDGTHPGSPHHGAEAQLMYGESEWQTPVRPVADDGPSYWSGVAAAGVGIAGLVGLLIVG